MDATMILLKQLKAKHVISGKPEDFVAETSTDKVKLRMATDLFIRDAITGLGTILKEDLENHYYVTSVKIGVFGATFTYALIKRNDENDENAEIVVYAHEGLIKQHLAEKTIQKLKGVLS